MRKNIAISLAIIMTFLSLSSPLLARETENRGQENETEVHKSSSMKADVSDDEINKASTEAFAIVNTSGTLIEIGNTTAAQTTLVLRVTDSKGTKDITIEVNEKTNIQSETGRSANLSDWIAGDQVSLTAQVFTNSDTWVAKRIRNLSFHSRNRGLNGWITAVRTDKNEMDITWESKNYTLSTASAKLVAGSKNPAQLSDFKVGDRVRARVVEDNDGKTNTWKAETIVTLRRGKDLFMRVTRWVVPATIISLPATSSLPTTIEVKILPSKFYEEGDVNNVIGQPRTNLKVDVTANTKLVRKYLGTATLSEFTEGDEVRITGRLDETTGHLVAEVIKNNTLQKVGLLHQIARVTAVDTTKSTIQVAMIDTSVWTITVTDKSTITRYRDALKINQIQVGDILRIRGVANTSDKTIVATSLAIITDQGIKISKLPAF